MGDLERFSAEVGARLDLVQGAGGNISEKPGGVMRIKASGAWLCDALDKPIFVDVELDAFRDMLAGAFSDDTLKAALAREGALRPSIETPLHALSPFRFVAHVHSANTIAWSVREDARDRLAERLSGIEWAFVPYVRPGAPLALAVRATFEAGRPQVLILGNHGLVVAAGTLGELRALLDEVEERLASSMQDVAAPCAAAIAAPPGYHWAEHSPCAFIAFDDARASVAAGGSLYPDHVVFLGPAMTLVGGVEEIATMIPPPKAAIVSGAGVLARNDLTKGALAMLDCLGLVLARLDPAAPVRYLSPEDEAALLGWDAETYRQALDKRPART
jgi:rhamnose utilization protein RhaD (predicted bifunctional aldolase and dehydrogenase)